MSTFILDYIFITNIFTTTILYYHYTNILLFYTYLKQVKSDNNLIVR